MIGVLSVPRSRAKTTGYQLVWSPAGRPVIELTGLGINENQMAIRINTGDWHIHCRLFHYEREDAPPA
jgi:hypothetical protein